jgi:hypothetical protein
MQKKMKQIFSVGLVLVLSLVIAGPVFAQEPDEPTEVPACEGDNISGAVVSVDEEAGTAIILTETGEECTFSFGGEYDHPIVALFNAYFGSLDAFGTPNADELTLALESTQAWMSYDEESETWVWASEEDEGAVEVTITSVTEGEEGSYTVEFKFTNPEDTADGGEDETLAIIIEDETLAEDISSSLDTLNGEWSMVIGENGTSYLADVGDQIIAYHDDDYGFGELVKIYAIVAESHEACSIEASSGEGGSCELTVEGLIAELEAADGDFGVLFQTYGRPSMMGVGHIRQALWSFSGSGDGGDGSFFSGICNARSHGGKATATGKNAFCP